LLFPAGDVAQLAARLAEVLKSPALRDALGDAGRRAVHERFTADEMARKTLDLYRQLSHGSTAARMA
jgi:glycosyltransferase involved in cell wall biosynthesis